MGFFALTTLSFTVYGFVDYYKNRKLEPGAFYVQDSGIRNRGDVIEGIRFFNEDRVPTNGNGLDELYFLDEKTGIVYNFKRGEDDTIRTNPEK